MPDSNENDKPKLPIQYREYRLEENGIDVKNRTARFSFASTHPVKRWYGIEILSHDDGAMIKDRLDKKAVPYLDSHIWEKQIGKIVDNYQSGEKSFATAKISRNKEGEDALRDMADGIRTEISVGYKIHKMTRTHDAKPDVTDDIDEYTITKWEPVEISLVSVPADHTVGIGRDGRSDSKDQLNEVEVVDSEGNPVEGIKFLQSDISIRSESDKDDKNKDKDDDGDDDDKDKFKGKKSEIPPPVDPPKEEVIIIKDQPKADIKNMLDVIPPVEPSIEVVREQARVEAREQESIRVREIGALGEKFNCRDDAAAFIRDNKSINDFYKFVMEDVFPKLTANVKRQDGTYGLPSSEMKRYNLGHAILDSCGMSRDGRALTGKFGGLTGFEAECDQELRKVYSGQGSGRQVSGFLVPEFALLPVRSFDYGKRVDPAPSDVALVNAQGGFTIQTSVEPALIPLLRHKMVIGRAGATMMGGLVGNMALPRQITAATATWNNENATVATSGQTFDQVLLNPQRLSALTAFSKQLLAQSQLDAQSVIRDDLLKIIAIAHDLAGLAGTGGAAETALEAAGDQPIGILSLVADTSYPSAYSKASPVVTFASGYPDWTHVVQFEGNVEQNDIDLDDSSCAYITSPKVKALWKTLAKTDPRAVNLFYPEFLWEEVRIQNDARAGMVNGYPAFATNQLNSTDQVIFGRFSDLVIGMWGGLDLVTDPYTLAASFQIRIIVNLLTTIAFRYGPAFCYSSNSGLQH